MPPSGCATREFLSHHVIGPAVGGTGRCQPVRTGVRCWQVGVPSLKQYKRDSSFIAEGFLIRQSGSVIAAGRTHRTEKKITWCHLTWRSFRVPGIVQGQGVKDMVGECAGSLARGPGDSVSQRLLSDSAVRRGVHSFFGLVDLVGFSRVTATHSSQIPACAHLTSAPASNAVHCTPSSQGST